jgi:hypothetical protein
MYQREKCTRVRSESAPRVYVYNTGADIKHYKSSYRNKMHARECIRQSPAVRTHSAGGAWWKDVAGISENLISGSLGTTYRGGRSRLLHLDMSRGGIWSAKTSWEYFKRERQALRLREWRPRNVRSLRPSRCPASWGDATGDRRIYDCVTLPNEEINARRMWHACEDAPRRAAKETMALCSRGCRCHASRSSGLRSRCSSRGNRQQDAW